MKVTVNFTRTDFINLEVALRLRIEACEENGDTEGAAKWSATYGRVQAARTAFITEAIKQKNDALGGGK